MAQLEDIIKVQPKGLITIPKKLRKSLGFEENGLARARAERGRLVLEPLRILPYPVRTYTKQEIREFFRFDEEETENLRKKGLLR